MTTYLPRSHASHRHCHRQVWVEAATGDLRLLLSKSDVFDENSQPVKTGVLRVSFDPPLWDAVPSPDSCAAGNFTKVPGEASTIGAQNRQLKNWQCVGDAEACTAEAARQCCQTAGCVAYSVNPTAGVAGGVFCELFSATATTTRCGPGWSSYTLDGAPPDGPPSAAGCGPNAAFCQTLDISTATVTIRTKHAVVNVSYELNAPVRDGAPRRGAALLHITATAAAPGGAKFGATVALEPYRVEGRVPSLGAGLCNHVPERADIIVTGSWPDTIAWYHRLAKNTTYFNATIANQGVDPASHPELSDPFTHRTWGGAVSGAGFAVANGSGLVLSTGGRTLESADIVVTLLTLEPAEAPAEASWLQELAKIRPAASTPAPCGGHCTHLDDQALCNTSWGEIMSRSFIEVTAAAGGTAADTASAKQITDHVNWDRYLALVQGRMAYAPIKFNGQAFNCNNTGQGWDWRDWGAGYWWQNTRQPCKSHNSEISLSALCAMIVAKSDGHGKSTSLRFAGVCTFRN